MVRIRGVNQFTMQQWHCVLLVLALTAKFRSSEANPFKEDSEYFKSQEATVAYVRNSRKNSVSQAWNSDNPRRIKAELEESFVEKDYELFVTNELELVNPKNIVHLSAASTTIRMITSISPLVINNDEMVSVSYYSSHPGENDWVAAYSPPDVDITTTVPIKYAWMDEDAQYNKTKHGTLRFNMTNVRQGVKFYFMTNGLKYGKKANVSAETLTFKTPNEQLRPRVVASGDPDTFLVLWSSFDSTKPVLKFRTTNSGTYTSIVPATTDAVKKEELCGYPANDSGWFDTGLIHTARMSGMKALAGKTIYYIFGDAATNLFSTREYQFRVPPLAGTQPTDRPTTVVLFDDLGRGSNDDAFTWNHYGEPAFNTSKSVGALASLGLIDAIYHGGDISYAIGFEAVWDFFMDMISPMAASTLYLTTVGNHESDFPDSGTYYTGRDSGGECGVTALKMLPQPNPIDLVRPWKAPWWSYDVGLIHFVGMSTEHNYTIGSPQYIFLLNDLKSVDRTKTPFIIFGGHRAMYLNSDFGGQVGSDIVVMDLLIANVEPLLQKYKVNLAFWGHNHVVQRQSAVYQKKVIQASKVHKINGNDVNVYSNPQGTVHMVIGTGGAKLTYNAVMDPMPAWNEMVLHEWGYALVKIHNSSYLEWNWINCMNDKIMDRVVITQNADELASPWACPEGTVCLNSAANGSVDKKPTLSQDAIVGIAIAAFLVIIAAAALFAAYYTRKSTSVDSDSKLGISRQINDVIPEPENIRTPSSFEVSATVSALHKELDDSSTASFIKPSTSGRNSPTRRL